MNKISKGMILIATSVVLSAIAQLFMRVGMLEIQGIESMSLKSMDMAFISTSLLWVTAGLGSYAVSMFLWMGALTKYELSFAYPLLSMSYVLVYIGAVSWPRLHEDLSLWKTAGIVLIVIGVFLVTRDKK